MKSKTAADKKSAVRKKSSIKTGVTKVVDAIKNKIKAKPRTKPKTATAVKPPRKTPRKTAEEIPAILLEGDQTPPVTTSGPGKKFVLTTTSPVPPPETQEAELPEAYGTKKLFLAARDPHWLYAHWDLTTEQQRRFNSLSAHRHLVLRVFAEEIKKTPNLEIHVHPESRHWFVHVDQAETKYTAELGYYTPKHVWKSISVSGPTLTPPDQMSADLDALFATIPMDLPFPQLAELVKEALIKHLPLAKALEQLRADGHPKLPRKVTQPAKWTPAQEKALAAVLSMDEVRRVWLGSMEITELIRRQLGQELSSIAFSPFGGVSSISSAFGGNVPAQKSFWFNVNAELIIYGATEPNATVTIGGRQIKLRTDGSFSYRFALPDGRFELPVVAVSADQTDARAAELYFMRDTEYRGEVGKHPQDPQLKTPHAGNVT